MNHTVKQIHIAFDAVLDILSLQDERAACLGLPPQEAEDFKALLESTAIDLMSLSMSSYLFSMEYVLQYHFDPQKARFIRGSHQYKMPDFFLVTPFLQGRRSHLHEELDSCQQDIRMVVT